MLQIIKGICAEKAASAKHWLCEFIRNAVEQIKYSAKG